MAHPCWLVLISLYIFSLSCSADVNASDNFKWTPLHFACRSGQPRVVELLLAAEASLDAVTFGGATPLMRAVESGRPEVVRLMLERGADIRPVNRKGIITYWLKLSTRKESWIMELIILSLGVIRCIKFVSYLPVTANRVAAYQW